MTKGFKGDLIGEALETGKSVTSQVKKQISPKKFVKSATEQVTGKAGQDDSIPPGLEDLKGKQPTQQQLQKMKLKDMGKRDKEMGSARAELEQIMIQRYKALEQDIEKVRQEKEQEEMVKEQQELQALHQEKEEKEQKAQQAVQPQRTREKGFLGIFVKKKKGTKELGKAKIG